MNRGPRRAGFIGTIISFFFTILFLIFSSALAVELDSYPAPKFSRAPLSFFFFREERPSFYWVNIGVPDLFFKGVNQISNLPNPIVYSIRSMEYGLTAEGWCTDQIQLRATIPFEANALVDAGGITRDAAKLGDLELGASYLLLGKKEAGSFMTLDGSFRFSTGSNPFNMEFPLLSSGKGASTGKIGVRLGQEVGGFSFFQSIHYEKTDSINVDASNVLFGSGVFQWPDNLLISGRVEYFVFRRARRFLSLYGELRARFSGQMLFNQQPLSYSYGLTTDSLFFSTGGMVVQVDKEFSAEGKIMYLPFETFLWGKGRPDFGLLFSLGLTFRPF